MKVMVEGAWRDVLDYWRAPDEARIQVYAWLLLERLDDVYHTPRRSLRTLIDYGREIGPAQVARKVASRLRERDRNVKWAACGLGRVIEAEGIESGTTVAFFAPCHPECVERLSLPKALVRPWSDPLPEPIRLEREFVGGRFWGDWGGWQRESGLSLDGAPELMDRVVATLKGREWKAAESHPTTVSEVQEVREVASTANDSLGAVVIGWGHHARTSIDGNLPEGIRIAAVHELDPVIAATAEDVAVDTCPALREDEEWDIVLATGYHSTHASTAAEALRRGAWVVSEKPLATSHRQLDELLSVWRSPSRYFAAFHKRHQRLNDWIREDLDPDAYGPMSYYCIAHEIALPERHWYRWPASGSRILSNGCHWIDHFLFLNDFAAARDVDVYETRGGELVCQLELENGAWFHMILTDRGSDRLGTREHVEIRTVDRTVSIDDGQEYRSESTHRMLRRTKFHKLAAHATMYDTIGRRILAGEPGDSRESVERSARLVLQIEEALRA